MKQTISTQNAPQAIGPYSQAIKTDSLIFCSGQIALKPDGSLVGGSIIEQIKQVMENLQAVLKKAGSDLSKAVKTTIYLKDLSDFQKVNEVYGSYFNENPPARATVEVSNLPKGVAIEIDLIALI